MSVSKINFNHYNYQNYSNIKKCPTCGAPTTQAPQVDSVSFKAKENDIYKTYSCKDADMLKYDLDYSKPSFLKGKYEITGDDVELEVKNKFGGTQNIKGEAFGSPVNLDIGSGFFGVRKGEVIGMIGDKAVNFKYQANENAKNIKISGNIDQLDDKNKALVIMLVTDKLKYDLRAEQEMEMAMMATVIR